MNWIRKAIMGGAAALAATAVGVVAGAAADGPRDLETPEGGKAVFEIFQQLAGSANELKGAEVETDVFFDGATVEDGRVLTYTYTVDGVANRPFDRRIARKAEKQLSRESCADGNLRPAIDGGGAVRYVYLSPGGTRVLVIEVDRESCLASE